MAVARVTAQAAEAATNLKKTGSVFLAIHTNDAPIF